MSNKKVIARQSEATADKPLKLEFQESDGSVKKFLFVHEIPGVILLDFVAEMDSASNTGAARVIKDFINTSLLDDEQRESWAAYAREPKNRITLEVMSEMVTWLAEKYSNLESETDPTGQAGVTTAHSGSSPQSATG